MSDIVDRLVRFAGGNVCISTDTEVEAAVEIGRLRAENEKLRAALKSILVCPAKPDDILSNKYKIIVPEYVLQEVAYVLESSCKAAALKEKETK